MFAHTGHKKTLAFLVHVFHSNVVLFYGVGGCPVAQVAQRCCGFSIIGDIQNLTGQSPESPALADPAGVGVWDGLDGAKRSLPI